MEKLIEATGIGDLLDRFPHTLSGGERQRVGLVRALTSQPRLVLLDEPFTSLNQSLRRELWWLMRELRQQQLTVLLVTHDLIEAYFLADSISVMIEGEIKQTGRKSAVYSHPATSAVAQFLGVNNLWAGTVSDKGRDLLTVECPTLGITVRFQGAANPPAVSSGVTVGILAEQISLRDAASTPAGRALVNRAYSPCRF